MKRTTVLALAAAGLAAYALAGLSADVTATALQGAADAPVACGDHDKPASPAPAPSPSPSPAPAPKPPPKPAT